MKKIILLLLVVILSSNISFAKPNLKTLSKSGTTPQTIVPRQMTQLEIREIETREFQTTDKLLTMKAMLDVLQDNGYIVETANPTLGFISGSKDVQYLSYRMTANISEFSNTTKVRMNVRQIIKNMYGAASEVTEILDAPFYQSLYYQIDKAIFNQKHVYN